MIDAIHEAVGKISGIVINPAGWTHTSVALADALVIPDVPIMEVHISNVHKREKFRQHSYVSPIASGVVAGYGIRGYEFAVRRLGRAGELTVTLSSRRVSRLIGQRLFAPQPAGGQVSGADRGVGSQRLRSLFVPAPTVRRAKLLAIVTGLLGFVLALATPLMPVKQTSAEIHWPSATGPVTSVSAPLTAYVPITMSATIPCAVIDHLGPDGTVLLSTTPKDAEKSAQRGLTVRKTGSSNGTSIRS